jgi:uncharacterized Zn-binding protein involved in type VI secretion
MPNVQRLTDANNGGGVLTSTPQDFVRVADELVAVVGAEGTAHGSGDDEHVAGSWHAAGGSSSVRVGGAKVIRTGDVDSCGHTRVGGATFCRVGP